jgi:D-aminoacyl-tRNA deacylase
MRQDYEELNVRAVVQRVVEASVTVDGEETGRIGKGVLVFLGVGPDDEPGDIRYLSEKIVNLRIFPDESDKMNLSVLDVGGGVLVISQFTLFGDCRKGRRPSYAGAAPPDLARRLYGEFVEEMKKHAVHVATGVFQEMMRVHLVNDGPVTLLLDSRKVF